VTRDHPPEPALHLPALDGLRFLAFLLVLIHHTPTLTTSAVLVRLKAYGWVGVELFFVISAFLFFHLLRAEYGKTGTVKIAHFYIRRILRIYPLMVAFTLAMFLIYSRMDAPAVGRLLGVALFSDNLISWFKQYNHIIPFSGHLWTLSFEFQVYLTIPLAFIALKRFGTPRFLQGIAALALFGLLLRLSFSLLKAPHPIIWVTPFLRPDSILLGILLALGVFARLPLPTTGACFLAATAAFSTAPLITSGTLGAMIGYPLAAVACASLLQLVLTWHSAKTLFSWAPLRFLGTISFGLYVFHPLCIRLATKWLSKIGLATQPATDPLDWSILFGSSLALTAAMATVSYFCLERPFLRIKDRFTIVRGRPGN